MSRKILIAAAGLVACGVAAAPAAACNEATYSTGVKSKAPAQGAPLVIGDSTMILAASTLRRMGMTTDAHGCRQFDAGLQILSARRHAGTLHPYAVLALGANGPVSRAQISRALAVMGPHRVLGLTTPRNSGSTASTMRAAAAAHPDRVLLIDWARYSAGHSSWFSGDGLHPDYPGAAVFARYIRLRSDPMMAPKASKLHLPTTQRALRAGKACGRVRRAGRLVHVFVTYGRSRITCTGAKLVASRSPLHSRARWRAWDWAASGRGQWLAVYQRQDRRVVVATRR
jgi:hypothetical protein